MWLTANVFNSEKIILKYFLISVYTLGLGIIALYLVYLTLYNYSKLAECIELSYKGLNHSNVGFKTGVNLK